MYNTQSGGFGLSQEVLQRLWNVGIGGIECIDGCYYINAFGEFDRSNPRTIEIIEDMINKLGIDKVVNSYCSLAIAEIPDNTKRWTITTEEYGREHLIYGDFHWYGEIITCTPTK